MAEDIIRGEENVDVEGIGSRISDDIGQIIEHSKHAVAVYLNTEVTLTYWRIGRCIANELDAISDEKYGSKIVSTVSRQFQKLLVYKERLVSGRKSRIGKNCLEIISLNMKRL